MFKVAELVSNHVAGDLGKRILRTRWVDTWKVATDGTKEPKSSLVVRRDQEEKSLFLEKFAPTASKAACIFLLPIMKSNNWEPVTIDIKRPSSNHDERNGMCLCDQQSRRRCRKLIVGNCLSRYMG